VRSSIESTDFYTNFPSSTEPLMASAFLYAKLLESNFQYPFKENQAAFQYAYEKQGESKYANQHLYATMYDQGRMASFNYFMEGKFVIPAPMPARLKTLGYDLDSVIESTPKPVVVDIGGGNGQMLLEIKDAFPQLGHDNLILEEFNAAIHPDADIQAIEWDAKSDKAQPVLKATIYSLMHVFHNTPDIESLLLMKKLSAAMDKDSRLLIHEFSKNLNYTNMHASMIAMMGGGERSSKQWHQMAEISGLKVTFEKYPALGEGLVEMRKI
jgi:hypothetical protein